MKDKSTLKPNAFLSTSIAGRFVDGPAIRKTRAAPGFMPFPIKAARKGKDPTGHICNGNAIINATKSERNPAPR